MKFSISPQVAAQVVAGLREVSSHELTSDDRKLISRLEANKSASLQDLEQHATNYIKLFS